MDIRIAAYGVIIQEQRILLAHWHEGGRSGWTLPGGGLDPGEDPADAARREILEETGYSAELDGLLGVDSHVIDASARLNGSESPLHAVRIIYRAHTTGGELTHEKDGSTDEAAWFALEQIPEHRVDLVNVGLRLLESPRP